LYDCDSDGISTYFSKALGRLFVFGSHPVATKMVEIIDGKPRDVPDALQQAYLNKKKKLVAYDLPTLGGVLFDGGPGKALFYDGEKVTSLLDSAGFERESVWTVEMESGSKHAFLNITSYGKNHLVRIEPDLSVTPLILPNKMLANARFAIYEFPQLQVFFHEVISFQQTLNIEAENTLRTVIAANKPLKIFWAKYFKSILNDGIVFDAYNTKTNQSSKYFIVRASTSKQCIAKLDPDKPIILSAE
jgi:hypothetical protein